MNYRNLENEELYKLLEYIEDLDTKLKEIYFNNFSLVDLLKIEDILNKNQQEIKQELGIIDE